MRSPLRKLHRYGRRWTWRAEIGERTDGGTRRRYVRVRIWGAGKTGRVLQADLVSTAPAGRWADPADDDDAYPAVEDIHRLIDHGLSRGWNPDTRGGTHHVTAADPAPPQFTKFRIAPSGPATAAL